MPAKIKKIFGLIVISTFILFLMGVGFPLYGFAEESATDTAMYPTEQKPPAPEGYQEPSSDEEGEYAEPSDESDPEYVQPESDRNWDEEEPPAESDDASPEE